ncbi:hypothetical protein ACK3F5_14820 [Photorhabdus asymbiotica UENP]
MTGVSERSQQSSHLKDEGYKSLLKPAPANLVCLKLVSSRFFALLTRRD